MRALLWMKFVVSFGVVLAVQIATASVAPSDTSYLDAMPEPAQVLRDYEDTDPHRAMVMQYSALFALEQAIHKHADEKRDAYPMNAERWYTPAEQEKYVVYQRAREQVSNKLKACAPAICDPDETMKLGKKYGSDAFHRSVLERYFKGAWLDEYDRLRESQRERLDKHAIESGKQERAERLEYAKSRGVARDWSDIFADLKAKLSDVPSHFRTTLLHHPDPITRMFGWGMLAVVALHVLLVITALVSRAARRVLSGLFMLEGVLMGGGFLFMVVLSGGCVLIDSTDLHPVLTTLSVISSLLALVLFYGVDKDTQYGVPWGVSVFLLGLMSWVLFMLSGQM